MVTAELAVGLPALMLVVVLAVAAVGAVGTELRCLDAAAGAARLASRGQAGEVVEFVRSDGPPGASVSSRASSGRVTVTVRAEVRLPLVGVAAPVTVSGSATDPVEPGVSP